MAVDRTIEEIAADPPRPELARLVGASGGGRLRAAIAEAVPEDRDAGTPLYLLLDDLAGATLIAPFAWSQSDDDWMERARERLAAEPAAPRQPGRNMQGVCAGFRPGSSALNADGNVDLSKRHNVASVPPLVAPDDPMGWHEVPPHPTIAMRRARRIDVWRTDGDVAVDAMFRDSCWRPDGTEVAVHEYGLDVVIDGGSGLVESVHAEPRVLPYPECPAAAPNVSWLVGVAARDLRAEVLDRLRGVDCCTHLNDALRALAEVPVLAELLNREISKVSVPMEESREDRWQASRGGGWRVGHGARASPNSWSSGEQRSRSSTCRRRPAPTSRASSAARSTRSTSWTTPASSS